MKAGVNLGSLTHPCRRDPYMQRLQGQTRRHTWNTPPRTWTWAQTLYCTFMVSRCVAGIPQKTLSHPSQDPSGLCNLRQKSRPSFKVELTEKGITRNTLAKSSGTLELLTPPPLHNNVGLMWIYPTLYPTLSLQGDVEDRPSGNVSKPASLPRCTPHRCNLSWCHLFV